MFGQLVFSKDGFAKMLQLNYNEHRLHVTSKNLKSAAQHLDELLNN